MRIFKPTRLGLFLWWLLALSLWLACQEKTSPPSAPQKEVKSLIRKELLGPSRAESGLPKRNIFSRRSGAGSIASPLLLPSGGGQSGLSPNENEAKANQELGLSGFSFSLRYIGYVGSAHRTIGLIFLDGQAQAVAEGEVIREGIRVGKISPTEIEIILPDSTSKKFSLEGE